MDPQEVVDQLKAAVVTAQANMESFQSSCTEVSTQVTGMNGKFQESTEMLSDELDAIAADSNLLETEIKDQVADNTEKSVSKVESSVDSYRKALESSIHSGIDELTNELTAEQNKTIAFMEESFNTLKRYIEEHESSGGLYLEALDKLHTELTEAEAEMNESISALIDADSNAKSTENEILHTYTELSESLFKAKFVPMFEKATEYADRLTNEKIEELSTMAVDTSAELDELITGLVDYASEKSTTAMKASLEEITSKIDGELLSTINEFTVKSQVGVAVTAATAPYLPDLAEFYKILEDMNEAISMWTKFKENVGN